MHLKTLFSPTSIAIIGASTQVESVGYTLTENLLRNGYAGKIYPINPKTDSLFGLRCYAKISLIPHDIDLAIIIVPAASVPLVLREAGEKGVHAAIVISSGFKETGEGGARLEKEIADIAREYDIALLGPNCLGFLRPALSLNASFAKLLPHDGTIAFFSQSGALCTAILDLTIDALGFSHFVSIGNKAVIDENELLRFFASDTDVAVISFYTEGLVDSKKIIETGRAVLACSEPKPIIALKSGTTAAGTQASISHTGALAGSDDAYQALFKQARMVRATSLANLLDLLSVFSCNPLPADNRIGIITNAGGLGVLATDAAIQNGLCMAPFAEATKKKLRAILPAAASVNNPVDVLGDALALRYRFALEIVAADEGTDMLLVIVTPQTMTQALGTAEAIIDIKKQYQKPIVAVFAGHESFSEGTALLQKNHISTLTYPESSVQALSALARVAQWRVQKTIAPIVLRNIDKEKAAAIIANAQKAGRTALTEKEASDTLQAYGFPFFTTHAVQNKEGALTAAHAIGKKVALKIISPDIIHKSDAGGVILDVDPADADAAYEKLLRNVRKHMPTAQIDGALVVEMAEKGGKELLLGLKKEPSLGTLLVFGLGGIYVEMFKDVTMRFVPLEGADIDEMVREIKSAALLTGVRGEAGIDVLYLKELLARLAQFALDFPAVEELDINPLLAFPKSQNFRVLDARIRIGRNEGAKK
ncbi:MAG: acetate--CoA ligase family protein [Candidatus Moraniibacteriota bacterium]